MVLIGLSYFRNDELQAAPEHRLARGLQVYACARLCAVAWKGEEKGEGAEAWF